MERDLIPGINIDRCNAYSVLAHMYAAISVEKGTVFSTSKVSVESKVPDDMKGGIIVFPQGADTVLSDIKRIIQKNDPAGWTIGRFFKGRHEGKNRELYSEESLSVEIIGISDDALIETSEDFCRAFDLKSVLIKSYAERNRIFVVE